MNKDGFISIVQDLNNRSQAILFFVINNAEKQIKKVDIDYKNLSELKDIHINNILKNMSNDIDSEFDIVPLSLSTTERKNRLYIYDYEKIPNELSQLSNLYSSNKPLQLFSNKTDDTNKLFAHILIIENGENKLLLYKKIYPINVYKAYKHFYLIESESRYTKFKDNIIKLNDDYDIIIINNNILINNISVLEKFFEFKEILLEEAQKSIELINDLKILEDNFDYSKFLENKTMLKKLSLIAKESNVLKSVDRNIIESFIRKTPHLNENLQFNTDGQIVLNNYKARTTFLKLLNDDFLKSELTETNYEVEDKETI